MISWPEEENETNLVPKRVRLLICGSSGSGKTQLLVDMNLKKLLKFKDLIIVTPSLFQSTYQVLIKGLDKNLPFYIMRNMLNQQQELRDYTGNNPKTLDYLIDLLSHEVSHEVDPQVFAVFASRVFAELSILQNHRVVRPFARSLLEPVKRAPAHIRSACRSVVVRPGQDEGRSEA